jgi:arginyl-tRNA--protein-N-Asp/Glu arginylyltransferase
MDQTPENAQFFLTAETDCPYLEGKKERKLFTHLSGKRASMMHHVLSDHGFRRSQNLIYRPSCDLCSACHSVRVVIDDFKPSKTHKRALVQNKDVIATQVATRVSSEQFDLFNKYLNARHTDGGMAQMSFEDYEFMVEDTPVDTILIEYRLMNEQDHPLIGVALTDVMPDGLSMVYSFFDPDLKKRGLGNFIILDHIERSKSLALEFVYLGYWVKDSQKMAYKTRFQPLQVGNGAGQWYAWQHHIE